MAKKDDSTGDLFGKPKKDEEEIDWTVKLHGKTSLTNLDKDYCRARHVVRPKRRRRRLRKREIVGGTVKGERL